MASYLSDEQIIQNHIQQVATILRSLNRVNNIDAIKNVGKILIKKMQYTDEQGKRVAIDPKKFLPKDSEEKELKNQTIKNRILAAYKPSEMWDAIKLLIAINELLIASGLGDRYSLYFRPNEIRMKNKSTIIPDEILNKLQDLLPAAEPHEESDNIQYETPTEILEFQNAEQASKRPRIEPAQEEHNEHQLGMLGSLETPAPSYILPPLDLPSENQEENGEFFSNL